MNTPWQTAGPGAEWMGAVPNAFHFRHEAMASPMEITIVGEDAHYARQAAQAAFAEADRLEQDLSRYIENSDISRLNRLRPGEVLPLGLDTFKCLEIARRAWDETHGAFDVSVGPLYKCWLNEDRSPRNPTPAELAAAAARTGMDKLVLDEDGYTARVLTEGMYFDLGGIGKGFAADRMGELLDEWGVAAAMINVGSSSLLALSPPPGREGWPVTLSNPLDRRQTLVRMEVANRSISGSGLEHGRHILDPRPGRGRPVEGKLAAWSVASDAATADALSTAFMVMGPGEVERYCRTHAGAAALLVMPGKESGADNVHILRYGDWHGSELLR